MLKDFANRERNRQQSGFYQTQNNSDNFGLIQRQMQSQNIPSYQRNLVKSGSESRAQFVESRESGQSQLASFEKVEVEEPQEDMLQRARRDPEFRKKMFLRQNQGISKYLGGNGVAKPVPKKMNTIAKPWPVAKHVDSAQAQHEYQRQNLLAHRPEDYVSNPRNALHLREREFNLPTDIDRTLAEQNKRYVKKRERITWNNDKPSITLPNPNRMYPQDFNPNMLNQKVEPSIKSKFLENPEYYYRQQWKRDIDVPTFAPAVLKISEGTGRADAGPIQIDAQTYQSQSSNIRDNLTYSEREIAEQATGVDYDGAHFQVGERPGKIYTMREYQEAQQELEYDMPGQPGDQSRGLAYEDETYLDANGNVVMSDDGYLPQSTRTQGMTYREAEYAEPASTIDYGTRSMHRQQHQMKTTLKDHHVANPSQGANFGMDSKRQPVMSRGINHNDPLNADIDRLPSAMQKVKLGSVKQRGEIVYEERDYVSRDDRNTALTAHKKQLGPVLMDQVYSEREHADDNNKFTTQAHDRSRASNLGQTYTELDFSENISKQDNVVQARTGPKIMGQMYDEQEYENANQQTDRGVTKRISATHLGQTYREEDYVGGKGLGQGQKGGRSAPRLMGEDLSIREMLPRDTAIQPHIETDQRGLKPKYTVVKQGMDRMKSLRSDATYESREKEAEQRSKTKIRGIKSETRQSGFKVEAPKDPNRGIEQSTPVSRKTMIKRKPSSVLASPVRRDNFEEAERIRMYSKHLNIPNNF